MDIQSRELKETSNIVEAFDNRTIINKGDAIKPERWSIIAKQLIKVGHPAPRQFWKRNLGCISPGKFYNHKSQTFKKNKRKGI